MGEAARRTLLEGIKPPAPPVRARNCGNCECGHFAITGQAGECHLNPPSVSTFPIQNRAGGMSIQNVAAWPPIAPEGFCITGWKPRTRQDEQLEAPSSPLPRVDLPEVE